MMPAINEVMLAASGSLTASIVVKATVFLAMGLTGASIARKSRASVRHALLAAAFGVLLTLPVVSIVAPPVRIVVPAAPQQRFVPAVAGIAQVVPPAAYSGAAVPAPRSSLSVTALLLMAWMAGAALFLAPVLMGLWQVRSLRRSALPWSHGHSLVERLALAASIRRRVDVLLHEHLPGPMTCGAIHPAIVLPEEAQNWDTEDLNRAIVHELEHVQRGDWMIQSLARAVCAMYWFHPLVWMAWRRLTLEAERSCDDAVLGRSDATAYADQLVGLARRLSSTGKMPLLAMVNRSDLATRVGAVLDSRQRRGRAGTLPVALACAAAAVLVLTISPFRMVAAPQAPTTAVVVVPEAQPANEPAPPTVTAAAEPAPAPQSASPAAPVPQFAVRSALVVVTVTVTDLAGNSIEGLGARDFVLTEDGVAQTISTFEFQKPSAAPGTSNAPASYYIMGYYPANQTADGQFRRIQVIDKNDTTAKLEYRSGYYPNKEFVRVGGSQGQSPAGGGSGVIEPAAPLPPGTTLPVLVFKKEPAYSDEARKAKYQGTVTLYVEVDETGQPVNLKVLRSLGLGLDEKAMEAVKQWRFKPGTTYGKPVTMATQVKVDFRLL